MWFSASNRTGCSERRATTLTHIETEHPDYIARKAMYRKYRDLYAGGEQIQAHAGDYLRQRDKETAGVYHERLAHAFYENYVGSIIDWYAATLFRREPELNIEGANGSGRTFFNEFAEDCDLKGTSLADFFRGRLIDTLINGVSYTLVDFPKADRPVGTRAEEDAAGLSRAYLVDYSADSVTNWSLDARGRFEWVVLRSSYLRKENASDPEFHRETEWRYYDRERYQVWRLREKRSDSLPRTTGGGFGNEDHAEPALIDEGLHALASQQRVPLFEMRVSDGLWLMSKAASLQIEHFNKSNALGWAMSMGLFSMPVVYSERGFNQILGESYYIHLGSNDRFGWTEPEGKVFQIAASNLARLQEEIYRVCYLLTQAHGTSASAVQQSGLSKLRDFAITQEVLRAYGDAVKDCMKRVLRAIETAREDDMQIGVSGLDDFDIGDFSSDLEDAKQLLSLGIGSPTLRKQVFKRLAFKYLCDSRQELKDEIAGEIERSAEEEEAWKKQT